MTRVQKNNFAVPCMLRMTFLTLLLIFPKPSQAMDRCFVLGQIYLRGKATGLKAEGVAGTETLTVLSGGAFNNGSTLGAGEFNEILSATVEVNGQRFVAAEKMFIFSQGNQKILDNSVILARKAALAGLAPEVYGVKDVYLTGGQRIRLLYTYQVGSHAQVVIENGKPVYGPLGEMRRFSERLDAKSRAAFERKIARIRAVHPDASDQNILVELRQDKDTKSESLEVFGVDWDPNTEMTGWTD